MKADAANTALFIFIMLVTFILVVLVLLQWTGVIDLPPEYLWALGALDLLLAWIELIILVPLAISVYKRSRGGDKSAWQAFVETEMTLLPPALRPLLIKELEIYRRIYLGVKRKLPPR